MATHTLTLTWLDGDGTRIYNALKDHYGQIEDPEGSGIYRDMTVGETLDHYDSSARKSLSDLVYKFERQEVATVAVEDVDRVPIT